MIVPKLKWNRAKEEGEAVFPDNFDEQDYMLRIDALQDWIVDLNAKYEELLRRYNREIQNP
jgi:hypothetical protein